MAHIFALNLEMLGTVSDAQSPRVQKLLEIIQQNNKTNASEWELSHLKAAQLWAVDGNLEAATKVWEDILAKHPSDLIALKLAYYVRRTLTISLFSPTIS
jgi:hypothetical protein